MSAHTLDSQQSKNNYTINKDTVTKIALSVANS
jgi:hypothetical protein